MKAAVLDNSAISAFAKIGKLTLLKKILGKTRVYIADAVYREIIFESVKDIVSLDKKGISDKRWILLEKVNTRGVKEPALGDGELGTIKLAIDKNAIAIIDDLNGRKFARKHNVRVVGTLALLKGAYGRKLINRAELKKIIHELEVKDQFRITDELKAWVLRGK